MQPGLIKLKVKQQSDKDDHLKAGFRYVPDAVVRKSAYIAKGVVLMPSFVNLGAVC